MPEPLPLPSDFIEKTGYERTEWFGRYRLWFDQVSPRRDDGAALIAVPDENVRDAVEIRELLPQPYNWPLQLLRPDDGYNDYDDCEKGRLHLCFDMLSDVCYIDMRNLYWAASLFAPYVGDAHFFVYSSGDGLDRWIDEYRYRDGALTAQRHTWPEPHMRDARIDFYLSELEARDETFRAFVRHCIEASSNPNHRRHLDRLR